MNLSLRTFPAVLSTALWLTATIPALAADGAPPPATSASEAYVVALQNHLADVVRYPRSVEARAAWPTGTVLVWLELDRSGALRASGIEAGSGSHLLDEAALAAVRRIRFPVFPREAFAGRASLRFSVPFDYVLMGQ